VVLLLKLLLLNVNSCQLPDSNLKPEAVEQP
jgi:hypothetical protein